MFLPKSVFFPTVAHFQEINRQPLSLTAPPPPILFFTPNLCTISCLKWTKNDIMQLRRGLTAWGRLVIQIFCVWATWVLREKSHRLPAHWLLDPKWLCWWRSHAPNSHASRTDALKHTVREEWDQRATTPFRLLPTRTYLVYLNSLLKPKKLYERSMLVLCTYF